RLGRSMEELTRLVREIEAGGAQLRSLNESIDTSSAVGRFVFHMFAAMAEFERNLLIERTNAGLAAARARGRRGGRKPEITPVKRRAILSLLAETGPDALPMQAIADQVRVTKQTLYRHFPGGRDNAEVVAERAKRRGDAPPSAAAIPVLPSGTTT
ncbi:MAG TPA: recombinase family protein, partial [Azospirillaceae bacterium]|nr:recombinase family protein [Azospirillaceae bacterium]